MPFFAALKSQLQQSWESLSWGHRFILFLLLFIVVSVFVGGVYWVSRPDYTVLYAGLSRDETAKIAGILEKENIPARLGADGGTIMVPSAFLDKARIVVAQQGLPRSSGVGFAAFREPRMGLTPFAERVNFLNALQAELARTIMTMDQVEYARVHLVIPKKHLFMKKKERPRASVMVVLRRGYTLDASQVAGISSLVASAVEGLDPADVTVMNERGEVLSGYRMDTAAGVAGQKWLYQKRVEEYLASKAAGLLKKVLGPGRFDVKVSVELAFKDVRQRVKEYDPTKRVVVKESLESNKRKNSSVSVGGPVGVTGGASASVPAGSEENSERTDTEYVVGEKWMESMDRGAEIKRLSVAAVVDLSNLKGAPDIKQITEIIKDAVGFSQARGDSIRIVEAQLVGTEAPVEGVPWYYLLKDVGGYALLAGLALVVFLLVRRVVQSVERVSREVITPEVVVMGEDLETLNIAGKDRILKEQVDRYVMENPELASRMLEGWVEGEGGEGG